MAQLTTITIVTYPDEIALDVRDTIALFWGWTATIDDGNGNQIPNPISKAQFIQPIIEAEQTRHLKEFLKNTFKAAKQAQIQDIDITGS